MRLALLVLASLVGCTPVCEDGRICVIAGTGDLGFTGEALDARDSRLASPTSVLTDPEGRVVVVDYSNMRLRRLEDDGTLVTIAGNGVHAYSEPGLDALDSPLENPVDAAWGPDGQLYILPQHEGRLVRLDEAGRIERVVATGVLADGGDGGDALDATLGYTAGLAFAPDGTLFVSDNTFSRVRRVALDGTIDTILGTGEGGMGTPGFGPDTAILGPERLVVDGERLLVADAGNHRVLAVDLATLDVTLLAGNGEGEIEHVVEVVGWGEEDDGTPYWVIRNVRARAARSPVFFASVASAASSAPAPC